MATQSTRNDIGFRILCRKLVILKREAGLQWLIGSPFLPSVSITSTIRFIHTLPSDALSPHLPKESDEIRSILPRGFEIIGPLIVHDKEDVKIEKIAGNAISAVQNLRKTFYGNDNGDQILIGAVLDLIHANGEHDLLFFTSREGNSKSVETVSQLCMKISLGNMFWREVVWFGANSHYSCLCIFL